MNALADHARRITELERRLTNTVRIGTIKELDAKTARLRVSIGPLLTTWLPWLTHRAGNTVTWSAPTVGEQVLVISPMGELAQGVAIPALYQNATPAPHDNPAETITTLPGGLKIKTLADGSITIVATRVTIDAPITTTGPITSAGDHVAGGISLINHTHGGVQSGGSQTKPPS